MQMNDQRLEPNWDDIRENEPTGFINRADAIPTKEGDITNDMDMESTFDMDSHKV